MIRNQVSVILGALAALVGGVALAADAAKPTFEALDKNSDGKVSLNEAADNEAWMRTRTACSAARNSRRFSSKPSAY
jgi:hypothetical protein